MFANQTERHQRTIPTRPVVLIMDGHAETLALYALALSAMGFEVVAARSGDDAHRLASAAQPDIIVVGIGGSGIGALRMDGWSVIQRLKREPETQDIPLVVLTGDAPLLVRERAAREGCVALFVKPCLPDQLALGLREVLNRNRDEDHAAVRRRGRPAR